MTTRHAERSQSEPSAPDAVPGVVRSRLRTRIQFPPLTAAQSAALRGLARFPAGDPLPARIGECRGAEFSKLVFAHKLHGIAAAVPDLHDPMVAASATTAVPAYLAEADAVRHILAGAGIHATCLKGAWISRALYPRVSMRPMSDVDLLIEPREVPGAIAALAASGFVVTPGQPLNGPSKRLHAPQMHHPDRLVAIELHHRIARTITRGRLAQCLGADLAVEMPPVAHMLHRLVDIAKDGWARAGLLAYADLLLLHRAGVTTDGVLDLARGLGVGSACASVLLAWDEALGTGLSDAERARCRRAESPQAWLARRIDCADDALLRQRYTPRWQRRVRRWTLGRVH